jgi:recombinational DNA repair protein (RecF pathway)
MTEIQMIRPLQEDGLVLKMIPFKDYDLVASVLLRNGHKQAIYLKGARGRPHPLRDPIDAMKCFRFQYRPSRNSSTSGLFRSEEWICQWSPQALSHHVDAYYLACLFLDCLDRMTLESSEHHEYTSHDQTDHRASHSVINAFTLLSNALFYLDQAVSQKKLQLQTHFILFFTKLLTYLGLFPQWKHCLNCQTSLSLSLSHSPEHLQYSAAKSISFHLESGGFHCASCSITSFVKKNPRPSHLVPSPSENLDLELWSLFVLTSQTKYSDYSQLPLFSNELLSVLTHYTLYHTSITLPLLDKLSFHSFTSPSSSRSEN